MSRAEAVTLQNVTKNFRMQKGKNCEEGFFTVLNDISFRILQGECIVIGGANGSGKTILMSIIAGLVKPSSGKVIRHKDVGLVFQDADTQLLGETPLEDVCVGLMNKKMSKQESVRRAEKALEAVSLLEKADFPARSLSGGEKRRLASAGITALNREIIIFDEPFANLDFDGVRQVVSLIKTLKEEEKTVLILTHELEKCLALADRLIVLHKGKVMFDGTPQAGLEQKLEEWGIRNPLQAYKCLDDLVWD